MVLREIWKDFIHGDWGVVQQSIYLKHALET